MLAIGAELLILIMMALGVLLLTLAASRSRKNRMQQSQVASAQQAASADFDGIRARIERRYRRRYELAAHVVMFLFIVGGLMALRVVPPPALALLGGAWALILVVHGLQVLFAEFTDRAIERAIEQEQAQTDAADKPKRDWQVRLSDDGEVLDVIDDEWDVDSRQKRA